MYCIKCGADNSETASYCRKCGEAIAEQETRVATRRKTENGELITENANEPGINEREIFAISPTLLFVKAGYVAAVVGAASLVVC